MTNLLASVALTGTALLWLAAPSQAAPGYGDDCIMPGVSTCRLTPDADGPHDVQVYCPGQGWINVFATCRDYYGPYSPYN